MTPIDRSRPFAADLDEYQRKLAVERALPADTSKTARREAADSADRALARLAFHDPLNLLDALAKVDAFARHPRKAANASLETAMVQARGFAQPSTDPTGGDSCAACRFWDVYTGDSAYYQDVNPGGIGDCRRRAPGISEELLRRCLPGPSCDQFASLANDLYPASAFPVTADSSWCGEFEARAA